MGLDLRLLPLDHLSGPTEAPFGYAHSVLGVPRCRELWDAMSALPTEALPRGHAITSLAGKRVPDGACKGELMYGRLERPDAYGTPLAWVSAAALVPLLDRHLPDAPVTAYLKALPPTTKVVLDWH